MDLGVGVSLIKLFPLIICMTVLTHIVGNTYVVCDVVSLGVFVKKNGGCVLIDTGIDKDSVKAATRLLRDKGHFVEDVINTHAHADHCGGNAYLTNKDAKVNPRGRVDIYASPEETPFIEHPWIEPLYFYGGAWPITELRSKILEASPSKVTGTVKGDFSIDGHSFQAIPLPGHTPGMIGVMTEDGVLFCGDAMFSEENILKHGLPYYTNIRQALESLKKIPTLGAKYYVVAHGGVVADIGAAVQYNTQTIWGNHNALSSAVHSGMTIDDLVKQAHTIYPSIRQGIITYMLTRTIVMAHLAMMQEDKQIQFAVKDGALVINRVA